MIGRWLKGGARSAPLAQIVIERVSREGTRVRMELERDLSRFDTVLAMRSGSVVVGKPDWLQAELNRGDWGRFALPWDDRLEVRMEILTPNFNLTNGTHVFLCKMPEGNAKRARRSLPRFNTRRFRNLHLLLPRLGERFRILDISPGGCKVDAGLSRRQRAMPVGRRLEGGSIHLGKRVRVELDTLVPRAHSNTEVGLQFDVSASGDHNRYLSTLLATLEALQLEHLHLQPV